ncbi:DUF4199 domain-containing protein [Rufibacter roseus]|uniref:DUF4199 domain-containing protein n=1 Tax=Rufibacter roseus TaxID=1567108 RepID=A0ABW2DHA9_9BACT|nr:DUF4199 domain-containing protein [Rufibacter roseus]
MDHQTTTPTSVAIRYGLITGFVSIIFALILYVTQLNTNTALSWIGMLIPLAGIILAYKAFKNDNGGYMSYGQGLGIGTLLSTISGLLGGIFHYVYVSFIDAGVMTRMRDAQVLEMEKKGLSDEQIEQALGMAESFTGPTMMLVMSILGGALLGFLISLVVAAIMKNNQPEFE